MGAVDMYFCTSVDNLQGNLDLTDHCIAAMNAQTILGEEHYKACVCHIGEMIFSVGGHPLANRRAGSNGELGAIEWLKQTLSISQGEHA